MIVILKNFFGFSRIMNVLIKLKIILKVLVTGGAGFIGSNLIEALLKQNKHIICLDNLSTGFYKNIDPFISNPNFTFIEGDIRKLSDCEKAIKGVDYVLHQAALGSVPRSIKDPITTNEVNIQGFINMLVAARDAKVKRFVYAASSSTYGDSENLPKIEDTIGNPLSPYAVTKYVNELYADVFARVYNMECVGLRYFNVFGKNQDPSGAYAAVIPLWVKTLMEHKSPVINGDGSYSRDFTYIKNVVQANILAMNTPAKQIKSEDKNYTHEVFNIAFGGNTTLIMLYEALKNNLAIFDSKISSLDATFGPFRDGDIPHSQASIKKAQKRLGYQPKYDAIEGFELACEWYFNEMKNL